MKKILALLLVLAMLLSVSVFASAEGTDAAALPAVGDEVNGFVVQSIREFPMVGATVVCFEHARTGAELMYIANSDTNRVFDLTFFTRAIDNTGLPHVFEHSTLDGSEKYPSKALFFNLSYQTYNTYMNAMTSALYTTYPVASLSEAQLLRYADYYTDSCLHPTILEDESIFREEAWRYRMADPEDDLSIEGTVYSEMQGAMDILSSAYTNLLRTAFPGSTIGNVSGGDPVSIPDMTWESLRNYHDLYYHPSNCCAFLYGQFDDYAAFLKLLDDAFAPYERREFSFEDEGYAALTEPVETTLPFPVESGSSTDNASLVFYAFVCPGLKDDPQGEEMVLNTLTDLLVVDASPLQQRLKKVLPSGRFASYIELDGPEDMIVFYGQNINGEDAPVFKQTVDEVLAELAETGFAADLVDGVMSSLALSTKLAGEADGAGVDLISSIASYYSSTGQAFGYMDYVDALEKIGEWNEQGLYQKAISERLLGSEVTVLCSTCPEAGLREELDAAEADRLAEVKASMSEEELQAIIDQTNAEDLEDDASAYVAALQAVTVGSLPEEIRLFDVSERTGDDGVRYIDAAAEVDGVGSAALLLDASGLAQEDIHWFALYTALLGELDSAAHSSEELAVLTTRYLYDGEIRLSAAEDAETGEFTPRLRAGWKATDEDLAAGYDLVYELLYETDFSDTETLLGLIQKAKASLKSSITSSPYSAMLYRAMGYSSPLYRYYSYFNGIEYYAFLEQAEQLVQEDPDAVIAKLEGIRDYFHNRTNAAAVYVGSEDGIRLNADLSAAFMAKLGQAPLERVDYALPQPARNEALIVDSTVQYNGIVGDFATMGLEDYSGDLDALSSLVSDAYLYPMLRDQYGAYSVFAGFMEDSGAYLITYRDPNVKETFEVYEAMPDFLAEQELDQETLDGYILSSYSYYAKPSGELSGGMNAALDLLTHDSQEKTLGYMRDLKAMTPELMPVYAEAYGNLIENGLRFTAGGAAAINANADLYDAILNPFGAVDSSEVVFEDLPEEHEHYEAARFLFENKLMVPVSETRFGVDDEATLGDLIGTLYALIDGDAGAQDEAVETFIGYGILPGDCSAADAISGTDADQVLSIFSQAAGVDYGGNPDAGADTLTRGELAEILMEYVLAL